MKLMLYYLMIAAGFLALSVADYDAGQAALPFVIVMALVPAVYGEWLRIFRHHDA